MPRRQTLTGRKEREQNRFLTNEARERQKREVTTSIPTTNQYPRPSYLSQITGEESESKADIVNSSLEDSDQLNMENSIQNNIESPVEQIKLECIPKLIEFQSDGDTGVYIKQEYKNTCKKRKMEVHEECEKQFDEVIVKTEQLDEDTFEKSDPLHISYKEDTSTDDIVSVNKQIEAPCEVLCSNKVIQNTSNTKDIPHSLDNKPTTSTMKTPDKTTQNLPSTSLSEQSSDIIYMVYNYLLNEYEYLKSLNLTKAELFQLGDTLTRTAKATGISIETVTTILTIKGIDVESQKKQVVVDQNNFHKSKRKEEEDHIIKVLDVMQDENSYHSDDELVMKCEVFDDDINKSDTIHSQVQVANKVDVCAASGNHLMFEVSPMTSNKTVSVKVKSSNLSSNLYTNQSINKPIHHNRHVEQYREEVHNIKQDDTQDNNSDHSDDMQGELVLKCEVFDDEINNMAVYREEEVHNIKQDDTQDNNSDHSDDMQGELVLKCEVFDDEINKEEEVHNIKQDDTQDNNSDHSDDMQGELVLKCEVFDDEINNESTKALTTEVQTITSRKKERKSNAQRCRDYRERKKLQNTMVKNITAERLDECSATDQLQAKKPKTNAERRKKHYEAHKLKKKKIKALNTSRKKERKSNAQRCREYRERKKLQNTMVKNITAERLDECNATDQLQAKKPKTNAERRKKYYEAQKLKKQKIKKIPKTAKQRNKEYYERKKKLKALNTLNHHSDASRDNCSAKICKHPEEIRNNAEETQQNNLFHVPTV